MILLFMSFTKSFACRCGANSTPSFLSFLVLPQIVSGERMPSWAMRFLQICSAKRTPAKIIVFRSCDAQMQWVYARRVLANMVNHQASLYWAIVNFIGNTMCKGLRGFFSNWVPSSQQTVALGQLVSKPWPTSTSIVWRLNKSFKSFMLGCNHNYEYTPVITKGEYHFLSR